MRIDLRPSFVKRRLIFRMGHLSNLLEQLVNAKSVKDCFYDRIVPLVYFLTLVYSAVTKRTVNFAEIYITINSYMENHVFEIILTNRIEI